ncbi:hypothetical protein QLX08_006260 [Tetragonisca angustula]|uniref:Uncharacterized protein n=1 Tax=Tetragonisca angustula TaxID=166442 RepID=A0AAW0ZV30_9HYME
MGGVEAQGGLSAGRRYAIVEQADRSVRNELEPTPQQRSREAIVLSGCLAACLSGYYAGADRRIVLPGVV